MTSLFCPQKRREKSVYFEKMRAYLQVLSCVIFHHIIFRGVHLGLLGENESFHHLDSLIH